MDAGLLALIEKAVREGIASQLWLIIVVAVVGSGLGAFLGAYLKKKAEHTAVRENFAEALRQLQEQTKVAEGIKSGFSEELEKLKALLGQNVFIRDLYGSSIKEYSSEQAAALRQVYLILYEPRSSMLDVSGKSNDERLDQALNVLMQPFRKYIGVLDEETIAAIYGAHNELLKLRGADPATFLEEKNRVFDTTEVTRQFVKVDRIALRLGLIERALGKPEREE